MKKYSVKFSPDAFNDLKKLDKELIQRILNKISYLALNFDSITPEPLKGNLKHFYKLRSGSWRVLYSINSGEEKIIIHLIGHRKDIYKI